MNLQFSSWERRGFWIAGILALFFTIGLRTHSYWAAYFSTGLDRSWDGSGHVALLQIYDKTIFPDTFGWTNAYFSGMSFPNFYPPLWYWSIAALHHVGTPLLLTSKLVVLGSMMLMPLVLARLSFVITGSMASSMATALLSLIPLLEEDMMPRYAAGLTFPSTFNEGIYTEPLGFLLLVLAITSPLQASNLRSSLRTGSLLSGALLSNVFTFVSALPFFIAVCFYPAAKRRMHLFHVLAATAIAVLLTAFWTVPVLTHYKYFVTVPVRPPLHEVISPALWGWLSIGIGCAVWALLRTGERMKVYVSGLLLLIAGCVLAYAPGLEGLPLQLPRLVAILAVLLALPIASAARSIFNGVLSLVGTGFRTKRAFAVASLSVFICLAGVLPLCNLEANLRADGNSTDMDALLKFAKLHNDGRYMVQTPHSHRDRFEARALSSYLGSQGNEAATVVFRESAPSSIFYVPLENKVSSLQQAFGISSSLDNDPAYLDESSSLTDSQLQELGVRYLMRLKKEEWRRSAIGTPVLTAGRWEIIELPSTPAPEIEPLTIRPALLFSDISYKKRRVGQFEANRIFEEQFRAGNYSRRIALSSAQNIDEMDHLESFGALILNKFEVHNEDAAFALVKNFSETRPVIVIPDSSPMCQRLLNHKDQLAGVVVIEVNKANEGGWLDEHNTSLQRDQITGVWRRMEEALRQPDNSTLHTPSPQVPPAVPVADLILIHHSFDPSWRSHDNSPVYLAGPSATLLSSKAALPLYFGRTAFEKGALLESLLAGVCVLLLLFIMSTGRISPLRQTAKV